LHAHGPTALGVRTWGEVAVLAPRNEWLSTVRKAFEREGLRVALQTRRNRAGDHPAYAWMAGLLAVCADPENTFEWVGVLREVFAVSDGLIAAELRRLGRLAWDEPSVHAAPLAAALEIVRPFVLRTNDEGQALGDFARELTTAANLEQKARLLDATGGMAGELDRLLAQAAELGLQGAGPRQWLAELLAHIDDGRPAGKPTEEAINLLTSHSAKGLEWPVVIVPGLWRGVGKPPEAGLKLVQGSATGLQVFFDTASIPADTREARNRERVRELSRLLYVTLTRARRTLVVPWVDGFGGAQKESPSFAELWGADFAALPELDGSALIEPASVQPARETLPVVASGVAVNLTAAKLPDRLLPHQLAHGPDLARAMRHESGLDEPWSGVGSEDAIDYGLWWHETMEFLPWTAEDRNVADYGRKAMAAAAALGFGPRAQAEWERLCSSLAWRELRGAQWVRQTEVGVFAPLRPDAWIDGVMDLVLHDPVGQTVWVLDWKTNRRRAGENDATLLARLADEYAPQLRAYGSCLAPLFPDCSVRQLVYSTVVGGWLEIPAG
jgi:ATP-dependent exoDNAse (exonuclease V) beta subunit